MNPNVKMCGKCGVIKNKERYFYRAGVDRYQTCCKPCHNDIRVANNNYIKRPTGFMKLDHDLREEIRQDISRGLSMINISRNHPSINYRSLLRWNKSGQIITV
jgi:hypothetical protein